MAKLSKTVLVRLRGIRVPLRSDSLGFSRTTNARYFYRVWGQIRGVGEGVRSLELWLMCGVAESCALPHAFPRTRQVRPLLRRVGSLALSHRAHICACWQHARRINVLSEVISKQSGRMVWCAVLTCAKSPASQAAAPPPGAKASKIMAR